MFTYENVKSKPKLFRALTGLDPAEFEELLAAFRVAWAEYVERKRSGGDSPVEF